MVEREKIEDREREQREQFEEEDKEHRHLPLLVVQLPEGTAFLLGSRLDSAVKRYISEVFKSPAELAW